MIRKRISSNSNVTQEIYTAWQNDSYFQQRRTMVHHLFHMLRQRRDILQANRKWANRLPVLVRRIELALYMRAPSLQEYLNLFTLKRRVQALIVLMHREGLYLQNRKSTAKKDGEMVKHVDHFLVPIQVKVDRMEMYENVLESKYCGPNFQRAWRLPEYHTDGESIFSNPDITSYVFSFLSAQEIMTSMPLNEYFYQLIPYHLYNCHVTLGQMIGILKQPRYLSERMFNVDTLSVRNTEATCEEDVVENAKNNQYAKWMAETCPQVPFHASNDGEDMIQNLSMALVAKSLPKLKDIQLSSNFVSTDRGRGVEKLMHAFESGCCPQLERLGLGGNSIGDRGAAAVATYLASSKAANLTHLDLRRNFIGEAGIHSLCQAMTNTPHREIIAFCLGGNVISDESAMLIVSAIRSGAFGQKLEFLGLEHNFLEYKSVFEFAVALCEGYCPRLREICLGENAITNQTVEYIFKELMQTVFNQV